MEFSINAYEFNDLFKAVKGFVTREAKPYAGVHLRAAGYTLTATALDGYKLIQFAAQLVTAVEEPCECVIPVLEPIKPTPKVAVPVTIKVSGGRVEWTIGDGTAYALPIPEYMRREYPDIMRIIPKPTSEYNAGPAFVDPKLMADCIKVFPARTAVRVDDYGRKGVVMRGQNVLCLLLPVRVRDDKLNEYYWVMGGE